MNASKFVIFLFFIFYWAVCIAKPRQEQGEVENHLGWTKVDFKDLVRISKSDCVIEPDNLVRCAGRLQIDGLSKIEINGNGATLEFTDPGLGKGGLMLSNANDVTLSDIKIGWLSGGARDPLIPNAQRIQSFGTVTICANQQAGGVLSLDLALAGMQSVDSVSVWDDVRGWPWYDEAPDAFEVYLPKDTVEIFTAGRSMCMPQLAKLVGRRVLVRHVGSTNHAFLCWGCRNVTIENVRVTSAPGMAFVFGNGGSNLTLRGDVVAPKCYPNCARPEPSVIADASHFSSVGSNIVLEDDDFGWQGDDSVNITGQLIPAQLDSEPYGTEHWILVDDRSRGALSKLSPGNFIRLYDRGLSELGEIQILDIQSTTGRLKVSSLPGNRADLIFARADEIPINVAIRNCVFHDNRARGILMGGSNAIIDKNVIERVTMEAILVPSDTGPWYEGPGAKNVRITNNTISHVNRFPAVKDYPSAISAGVSLSGGYVGQVGTPIRDVLVKGNSISYIYRNSSVPIFFGRGVAGGQASDNKIIQGR